MTTKSDILAATWAAFDEAGQEGLSMRDVASRVGITPMAIYRHFANRQALIDALVSDAVADWRARVAAVPASTPSQWLKAVGEAYLDFALSAPRRYEAAFLVPSSVALRYPDDFLAGGSSAVSLQLELLEDMSVQTGRPFRLSTVDRLVALVALSQGLVTLYRGGRISGSEREFRTLFARAMQGCIDSFYDDNQRADEVLT